MGKFGRLLAFLCVNKKKAACAKAASKVPCLAVFVPSHFMTTTTPLAQLEPAVSSLGYVFGFEDIKPRMLAKHLTLNEVLPPEEHGETASWDDWLTRIKAVALKQQKELKAPANSGEDDLPQEWWDDYWTVRRIYGVLLLPEEVREATHKMLFGAVTATPSWVALAAMGDALFTEDWKWNGCELRRLYQEAERLETENTRKVEAINQLLSVLEE